MNVFASTRKALVYFYDRFAKPYWLESPGLAKRVGMSDEDCWYGFKRGGWPVVTYANAPNNSLPPLWYPDSRCDTGTGCRALFMRVESRDTGHGENSFDANFERIRELNEKKKDRSAEVLRRLYEDYLGV